jgi:hypothetical protein
MMTEFQVNYEGHWEPTTEFRARRAIQEAYREWPVVWQDLLNGEKIRTMGAWYRYVPEDEKTTLT